MNLSRRRAALAAVLPVVFPAAALLAASAGALAQGFSGRPVRIVVPFAPGGGNDVFARQLGVRLAEVLGTQVVIDNRPGAGGIVGTELVARAVPDGHTLLLGHTGTLAINPALHAKLPYDAQADFAAVGPLAQAPLVLVVAAASPATTLAELLARARAQPGRVSFASSGNGTGGHLAAELLEERAGAKLLHVPYKGTAPALTDLLGGQVDAMFGVLPSALPHVEAGRLRALAVTGARRSARLPQVPTVAESGFPGYESTLAYGLVAPKGTPEPVLRALGDALAKSVESPALREALRAEGAEPLRGGGADFAALMRAEGEKWGRLIRAAGIRAE